MTKYIDAEHLIHDLEERIYAYSEGYADGDNYRKDAIETLLKDIRYQCSLQQEQPKVDLKNYISDKLRELGADLINHKPYSFNRGLNVGKSNAYGDILDKLNARKEDK